VGGGRGEGVGVHICAVTHLYVTRMDESRHICEYVVSHIRTRGHSTHVNQSRHTF